MEGSIEKEMSKLMLSYFVYPSVVVNKSFTITQFFGVTSPYLEPVTGKATLNILKIVREELVVDLGSLLQEVRKTEKKASKEGIRFFNKKVEHEITLEVVPRKIADSVYFLVVFKETGVTLSTPINGKNVKSNGHIDQKKIKRLEEELILSREIIRTTNEEYETTYEELQANNEEILSSNEELQSVNEELETSKEELQSSNEELTTTNEELHKRNIELSESQKELKRVNSQLEQFAFVSSHDLQEPLRKIETFSDLLSSPEAHLNEFAKKYSKKINTSAYRMSTLIKDLLNFSSLVNIHEKKSAVNLNEIVQKVLDDFEIVIDEKKAVIKIDSLPTLHAQPVQMNQLFHNLISNALKFSKKKPRITISYHEATANDFKKHTDLEEGYRYACIQIRDNGIGFDQKYAHKIFLLFQKLNDAKTQEGTGLGLSLCKKIMDDHNGFIFASGKVNKGSIFTIFLPLNTSE